jgi:phage terminase large subunit-like protein
MTPIPQHWLDLFALLPGYDPVATAEDCWFDVERAEFVIEFIETCCHHVKGELAGKTLLLEDWQKAFIGCLFGWKRPDGKRRYKEALLYIARKNGKTALAAAIVCAVLFLDSEPGAECYSAAAEREQARLCFEVVQSMIRQEPEMAQRAQLYKFSVVVGESSYKAISAEAGSKHGFNTHLLVNDELHAQKTPELTEVLMTSMGSRSQPLAVHLTTADYNRPESICNQKHEYAGKVRDGVIDDKSFLPVIYEAALESEWTNPEVWRLANPNMGVSVSQEYLERECKRAKESPAYENTFKRLHLNIITESDVRWLQMDKWDDCGRRKWQEVAEQAKGRKCCAGLDLSTSIDLTALVMVFFPDDDDLRLVVPIFWVPQERALAREHKDRVPYTTWIRQGAMRSTPGEVVDYEVIRRDINELRDQYNIRQIAYDPWNATQIATQLTGDGMELVEFRQGYASMNPAAKELEKLIIAGEIEHGGHPVLRWNAANCSVEQDPAGNIKPSKKKSTERIDGIVATVMGLGVGMAWVDAPNFYETNELEMA